MGIRKESEELCSSWLGLDPMVRHPQGRQGDSWARWGAPTAPSVPESIPALNRTSAADL